VKIFAKKNVDKILGHPVHLKNIYKKYFKIENHPVLTSFRSSSKLSLVKIFEKKNHTVLTQL
jgi:hypothetical protein